MALHFFGFANFWLVKLAKISLANGTFQKLGLSNSHVAVFALFRRLRRFVYHTMQQIH
jgi:hypothetical protein